MTIKRRWTTNVPFFGKVKRSKELKPGYEEIVTISRLNEDGTDYYSEKAVLRVLNDDRISYERVPFYTKAFRTNPNQVTVGESSSLYKRMYPNVSSSEVAVYEEESIKTAMGTTFGYPNELYSAKPHRKLFDEPELEIKWEPTLPPQTRK